MSYVILIVCSLLLNIMFYSSRSLDSYEFVFIQQKRKRNSRVKEESSQTWTH